MIFSEKINIIYTRGNFLCRKITEKKITKKISKKNYKENFEKKLQRKFQKIFFQKMLKFSRNFMLEIFFVICFL